MATRSKKTTKNYILTAAVAIILVTALATVKTEKERPRKMKSLTQSKSVKPVPHRKDVSSEKRIPSTFFPLKPGSKWIYQGTGSEYASFSREILFVNGNLAQFHEINGGADVTKVIAVTNHEVVELQRHIEADIPKNQLSEPANEHQVLLKAPLSAGAKWEDGSSKYEIISTSATVKTLAGTFHGCLQIKKTTPSDSSVELLNYAKDIGLVEQTFMENNGQISSSLKSYHIEK